MTYNIYGLLYSLHCLTLPDQTSTLTMLLTAYLRIYCHTVTAKSTVALAYKNCYSTADKWCIQAELTLLWCNPSSLVGCTFVAGERAMVEAKFSLSPNIAEHFSGDASDGCISHCFFPYTLL